MSFLLNEVRFTLAKYGEVEILPDRRRQAGADVGVTCPSPTRSCDDAHGQMKLLKIISSGMQPALLSENYKGSSTPTSPRSLTKAQLEGHVLLDLYHNPPVRRRTSKKARRRKRSPRCIVADKDSSRATASKQEGSMVFAACVAVVAFEVAAKPRQKERWRGPR